MISIRLHGWAAAANQARAYKASTRARRTATEASFGSISRAVARFRIATAIVGLGGLLGASLLM
jgi:hypothetical protein